MPSVTLPPIPPSDNLYKFTAIGGLILVVLTVYLSEKVLYDLKIMSLDIDFELSTLEIEEEYLHKGFDQEKERSASIEKDDSALQANGNRTKTSTSSLAAHDIRTDAVRDESKRKQHRLALAKVDNQNKKLRSYFSSVENIGVITGCTLTIGLLMTFYGFWNWYFKFQVYQDQIVKAQAAQWTTPKPEREKEEIPG